MNSFGEEHFSLVVIHKSPPVREISDVLRALLDDASDVANDCGFGVKRFQGTDVIIHPAKTLPPAILTDIVAADLSRNPKTDRCHTSGAQRNTRQSVYATGSEFSFQTLVPGQDGGSLHSHKTHEELYFILRGEGEYQVDGEVFPIREGSVIRVCPDGKRCIRNNGTENLTMLCIQHKANTFGADDNPMTDGNILQELLNWYNFEEKK